MWLFKRVPKPPPEWWDNDQKEESTSIWEIIVILLMTLLIFIEITIITIRDGVKNLIKGCKETASEIFCNVFGLKE